MRKKRRVPRTKARKIGASGEAELKWSRMPGTLWEQE
jgi:hypothetical protein